MITISRTKLYARLGGCMSAVLDDEGLAEVLGLSPVQFEKVSADTRDAFREFLAAPVPVCPACGRPEVAR